jgi:transmembrane sensor
VIGDLLDDAIDEERVGRLWAGTEHRARAPRRLGARVAVALAAFAIGAAAIPLFFDAGEPGFLALADGTAPVAVQAPTDASASVRYADGSTIELSAGARLVPVRNDPASFETLLERGRARFDVVPDGSRRWVVRAGSATVTVIGTRFVVEVATDRTSVAVERGVVRVDGLDLEGSRRVLRAGERIDIDERPPVSIGPARNDGERSALAGEQTPARPSEPPVALRDERDSAGAPTSGPSDTAEALMQEADRAREEGRHADAVASLERLIERHSQHRSAALAAIVLGRIEMDQLGRPARARRAFERALSLGVPAALRADVEERMAILDAAP